MVHIPVLSKEVLECLKPKPNENFIDCTIGQAGHALSIIERILPNGKVLGIDWSPELIQELKVKSQKSKVKSNLKLVCGNFVNLEEIVKKEKFGKVSGILFDLGLSRWHLEESGRGFTFQRNEPLVMRYNWNSRESILLSNKELSALSDLTAERIINEWPEEEIEKILREYGEERFAGKIAKEIIMARKIKPIRNTFQLVEIIEKAVPPWYQHRKINFATKTFQALRIIANEELENLKKALPQALEVLEPGGRLVVISFHSLEDRIVKNFYRSRSPIDLKILNKKPIRPTKEEIKVNPRSRSAKLRAAIKI